MKNFAFIWAYREQPDLEYILKAAQEVLKENIESFSFYEIDSARYLGILISPSSGYTKKQALKIWEKLIEES